MLMPSIFGENLMDDFMNDFTMPSLGRSFFEMPMQNIMKTDIKETEKDCVLDIDLPGYKKEDIKISLKNGYLTVTASQKKNEDQKNEEGQYLRRERYTGSASRSFYVGKNLTEENIHAKFDNGILTLTFPKEEEKKVDEGKYIAIEG